jgi:hypothetical protein
MLLETVKPLASQKKSNMNQNKATSHSQARPEAQVCPQDRRYWRDFDNVLDNIATSEQTCDKSLSGLSRDHLNYDVHQRVESDTDELQTNMPHCVTESVSLPNYPSLISLGLLEELEDDVDEQLPKNLTNENNPQGFSRRAYNAFMGRLRLHML